MPNSSSKPRGRESSAPARPYAATGGDAPSERLFAIMDCVIEQRAPISITEIGDRLSLPAPTVHRITKHLTERGYLKRSLGSKRLVPGPRLTELGVRAASASFASDRPHAVLVSLSAEINEHCQIGIMSEGRIVYLDSVGAPRPHGLQFSAGATAPLHCTSIGKLYLARMTSTELQHALRTTPLERFTETTICDPDRLMEEIGRVRRLDWAASDMEFSPGVVGCAVPILDGQRKMIAGLGASVPNAHVSFRDLGRLIPTLQAASGRISDALDI